MPLGRRRPLLRAAMVGGGAYAAGKHRERSREQQAPERASGGLSEADVTQLEKLGKLRDAGILTPAEFDAQKRSLLGGAS